MTPTPTPERMTRVSAHFFAALSVRIQELTAEGRDIIRLDEGAPDLPPAAHIVEALAAAARRPDAHSYQPHRGPAALRRAWMQRYQSDYGVDLHPEREIIPLLGSKEGIFHAHLAWVSPGEVVLVPDPGYITYIRGAEMAGGRVYPMRLEPESHNLPDLDAIPEEILRQTRLMWLNYPNNPTAAVADRAFFQKAVALARRYDFLVCHDAAYLQVAFRGERPPSLLEVPEAKDVAVEFNTLSKWYNMAGWRSGALLGNAEAVKLLYTLKTNTDSGHFLPVWEASIAALNGDQNWVAERNEVYRQRRDTLVDGLHSLGLPAAIPQASLYVWSPVPSGWDSASFARAALEEAGVSITPGVVFGTGGEGYCRITLTAPQGRIEQAIERLGQWQSAGGF